jgi:trigger factor
MKAEIINSGAIEKTVKVNLEWEEIAGDYQRMFDDLRKNLKIDGFRRGKVPEGLAKRLLKPDVFMKFSNQVIDKTHQEAMQMAGVGEFLDMHIVDLDFDENKPFSYTAKVEIDPEIKLPDYKKGYKVTHKEYILDPETVERYIADFLESHAEVQEVFDGAQAGHFILGDLQALDENGNPQIGKRLPDRLIKVGEGIFGDPKTADFTGAKAGDQVNLNIKSSTGESLKYALDVKRVEKHTPPELTDDFVKSQMKDVATAAEFRQKISDNLTQKWKQQTVNEYDQSIISYFVENTKFDIPQYRLNFYLDRVISDLKNSAKGKTIDEDKLREEYRPLAERNIRWYLIQKAIIIQENIAVSEEEFQAAIDTVLANYPEAQKEQVVKYYQQAKNKMDIRMDLLDRKVLEHLKEFAKIKKEILHTESLQQ